MSARGEPVAEETGRERAGETPLPEGADERPSEGGRGVPSVNRVRSVQSRVSAALAIALIGALGGGLLLWYYTGAATRQARLEAAASAAAKARASGEMALPPLPRLEPPRLAPAQGAASAAEAEAGASALAAMLAGEPPPPPTALLESAAAPAAAPASAASYGAYAPSPTPAEQAFARRLAGPVFASTSAADALDSSMPAELPMSGSVARAPGALGALLEPSVLPAAAASVLPTRRLLLPKGSSIDCTLETAIDSTLPGLALCITAADTFGADGQVVLLERGTRLIGETRGEVGRGGARLFILWAEARTPTGVVVPLASPATDPLGRSGITGAVDRHFWQRFGSAMLVSLIDGAIEAGVASARGEGDSIVVSPSGSREVLTEALKDTAALSPTIRAPQGAAVQALVARDLDFRSVYELEPAPRH